MKSKKTLLSRFFNLFKEKKNDWIVVDKFWGGPRYIEELVRYPDNEREVDLSVVNGNVGHGMTGFYIDGEWWDEDWIPERETYLRKIPRGITVAAWRELEDKNET